VTAPFVVFALPRCRTAWLARFLTYGDWHTGHDEIRHCRSLEDVTSWLAQPCTGTVETAAAPFWRLLPADVRVVTVRRPVPEVVASLARTGITFDAAVMTRLIERVERKLDQIEHRLPGVLSVRFADLADEATCARVFEHCLGLPHDPVWWAAASAVNIQISVPHMMRYFAAYAPQIEKLRRLARHEMLRSLRRPVELDGVTFQQEPFEVAWRDAKQLASDECVILGEYPEAWEHMNVPLLERLEAMGSLHVYTARSNGRMFGYLMSAIGEAFHARDQLEAEQVSFFADPNWPGLGRKLQHAAVDDLRAKGVQRVMMFQPDSTRVGLLYRRLGARQTGQRYVMELQ
jgi:hypothetical protein